LPGLYTERPPVIAGVALPRASSAVPIAFGLAIAIGIVGAVIFSNPYLALAVPFLAAGAAVADRAPAVPIIAAVLISSMIGTITAYGPGLPPLGAIDLALASLWIAVIWGLLTRGREYDIVLWPGLLLPLAYVFLTLAAMLLSDEVGLGFESFRLSAWYLLIAVLIAFAPWHDRTFQRIARGIVIIALVVGAYCVFRYVVGPSVKEELAARAAQPTLLWSVPPRFFGTMLSAQELAGWAAVILPLAFAMLLHWRRWWRIAALGAVGVCAFALLAADVRTGVAAAAAGLGVTIGVFMVARAFPTGVRIGTGIAALAAMLVIGGVGYAATVASSPETIERFEGLFDPGDDRNFQVRQERWSAAWDEMAEEPLGHGLGTTGAVAGRGDSTPVGPNPLDSSYLKVGIEQGPAVMFFYAGALLVLLLGLIYRAATTRDRWHSSLAMAAAGTLTAMLVLFFGSLYSEVPSVVIPGWTIVGLGAAAFTTYRTRSRSRPRPLPSAARP
jgi:hypothetical protein